MIVTASSLLKDLGRNVIGGATQRSSSDGVHVISRHHKSSQAEVANLGVHVLIQKDIAHLQITVYNALLVHVLDRAGNLYCIETHLGLCQALSLLDHLHERTV